MQVSLAPFMRHQHEATAGRRVADTLAEQMCARARLRLRAALHSVAYCCDEVLTNPYVKPPSPHWLGGTLADNVEAGEALVIFSDGNPKRGYTAEHTRLQDIADRRAAGQIDDPRPAQANAIARRLSRASTSRVRMSPEERQRAPGGMPGELALLAAHVLTADEFARLSSVADGVPVLAIIGDTRASGLTSGLFFKSVVRMPGLWLGTAPPAGNA